MVELDDVYMKSYLKVPPAASSAVNNMTLANMTSSNNSSGRASTDMSSGMDPLMVETPRILARSDIASPVIEDLKVEQIMINSTKSFLNCAENSQKKFDKKFSRTQTELLACLAN
jgi:hypothetical protein